jgi:hypothetical protein
LSLCVSLVGSTVSHDLELLGQDWVLEFIKN